MALEGRRFSGEAQVMFSAALGLVVVLLAMSTAHCKRLNSVAGPWRSSIIDIKRCSPKLGDPKFHTVNLDLVGYYNTSAKHKKFKGELEFFKTFARGTKNVHFIVAKWDSVGGWKNNFFIMNMMEACAIIDGAARVLWADLSNNTTPNVSLRCPLPKGTHRIGDWDVSLDTFTAFPALPYARYMGHMIVKDIPSQVPVFCTEIIYDVLPKEF